jgi:type II secretory pathway component PulC
MNGYRALSVALGLTCATLGAVIGITLREPAQQSLSTPVPAARTVAHSEPAPNSLQLDPVKSYDAISKRPLFSPTRQPSEPPPPPRNDNNRPTLTGIVLTGVVIGPADKIALMTSSKSPKPLSLIEGEKLEGWKLEKVMADRVVLSAGDETAEISVWDKLTAAAALRKPGARR